MDGFDKRAVVAGAGAIVMFGQVGDGERRAGLNGPALDGADVYMCADFSRESTLIAGQVEWRAEHGVVGSVERRTGREEQTGQGKPPSVRKRGELRIERSSRRRAAEQIASGPTAVPISSAEKVMPLADDHAGHIGADRVCCWRTRSRVHRAERDDRVDQRSTTARVAGLKQDPALRGAVLRGAH